MATFNGVVYNGSLNLRASTNTGSTALVSIPNHTALSVNTCSNNEWFQTTYNGYTGFVVAQYIAITNDGGTCQVIGSGSLNIRKSTSTSSAKLYSVPVGTTLRLLDTTSVNGWYRVSSATGTGWAMSQYLNIITAPDSTIPSPGSGTSSSPDGYATITSGYAWCYKTSGPDQETWGYFANGTRIPVWSISAENYILKTIWNENGVNYEGYVSINNISIEDNSSLSLYKGMNNMYVVKYKKRLYDLGYHPHMYASSFDGILEASVKVFQEKNGLTVDGIIGAATRNLLNGSPIHFRIAVPDWDPQHPTCQWFMNDSKWSTYPFPSSANGNETIGDSGNSITAMAMMLTAFHCRAFTPVEMAEYALQNNYRDPLGQTGVLEGFFTQIGNYTSAEYDGKVYTLAQIKAHVDNGGLAIVRVVADENETYTGGATHLVVYRVVNGGADDGVYVMSPNSNKNPSYRLSYAEWNGATWLKEAYLYTQANG